MKIFSVDMCTICGKHGHICLDGEAISPEFAFQDHGHEIIVGMWIDETCNLSECSALTKEEPYSKLPKSHETVDIKLLWGINLYNLILLQQRKINISIHDFIFINSDKIAIPANFRATLDERYQQK